MRDRDRPEFSSAVRISLDACPGPPMLRLGIRMAASPLALAWALTVWCIGCAADESPESTVLLVPEVSSPTALSRNPSIALIDDDTACVIDSYEHRVLCLSRGGNLIGAFGGQGDGPGEFQFPRAVMRAPDQTVAVLDPLSSRTTIFTTTGQLVAEVSLPAVFEPLSPIAETTVGAYEPNFLSSDKVLAEVGVPGGEILWQRELHSPATMGLPAHCGLQWGAMTKGDVAVFGVCNSLLLFYSPDAGGQATVVESPTYADELPNHRDIDEFREGARFMFGGDTVPDAAVRDFAETPKRDRIVGRSMVYDASERLWVATQRDRDRYSYFDLYVDTAFVGSVQVRDRLLGFDILNGTLVTLVERALNEHDADGVPDRGLDWYDVRHVGLGQE